MRWGAAEAARRKVPLRLVIGFGWPAGVSDGHHPQHGAAYRELLLGRARAQLAAAAAVAEGEQPGVEVEQQLIVGSPIAVLGAEARHAELVVIGDRGMSRVEGLLVGSVAVALAAHATCPVVIVRWAEREFAATAMLPVVLGVDGSATSEAAIDFAFEAAAARQVSLVAVHTWSGMAFDPTAASMGIDWVAIENAERENLARQLTGWSEKYPDTFVERLVTRDRPAHSLLEQAARAQLVVVGSRGRGEFVGLVLGSVGNALVPRAPCPVPRPSGHHGTHAVEPEPEQVDDEAALLRDLADHGVDRGLADVDPSCNSEKVNVRTCRSGSRSLRARGRHRVHRPGSPGGRGRVHRVW